MPDCRESSQVCRWSLGLPAFFSYGNRIGKGMYRDGIFGRSASCRRMPIPIYLMHGNRMTMGNRNEVES